MEPRIPVITIDGASGTGKGIVSLLIAKQLGWNLLDSGCLYRVLALAAQTHAISLENESALAVLANYLDVQFVPKETIAPPAILLEGQDVSDTIRTEAIGNIASQIAIFPSVRCALLGRQRAFRVNPGLVADGRDMGTVVFPDADVKIFLTASPEERAHRRYIQLKEKGINVNLGHLVDSLYERDQRDQQRAVAPLRPADDAVCIDTDGLAIQQVVDCIMLEVQRIF